MFRQTFEHCAPKSTSLPYPQDGGRRPDLALQCADWVKAANDLNAGFTGMTVTAMTAGFQSIHDARKTDSTWSVKDPQCGSWASQMAKRMQNLLRHCSQAASQQPCPGWLQIAVQGRQECKVEKKSNEAAETQLDESDEDGEGDEDPEEEVAVPRSPADPDPHDEPDWFVGYAPDSGQAYRYAKADTKKKKKTSRPA